MSLGNVLLGKGCLDWALKDSHCSQRKSEETTNKKNKIDECKEMWITNSCKGLLFNNETVEAGSCESWNERGRKR